MGNPRFSSSTLGRHPVADRGSADMKDGKGRLGVLFPGEDNYVRVPHAGTQTA